jgi:predicted house-cleaning noncanonical NTP pyrophosphatase (MazG superfamily)
MKAEEFYKQRSNSIRELWALSPKQIEYIALIMEEYAALLQPPVKGSALFDAMGKFTVEKFPDAGSVEHLKKLKHEADEAIAEPQNLVEYADILLALFGAAYNAGFTYEQLLEASEGKFEIVQKRNWKRLDDGTYQHCP